MANIKKFFEKRKVDTKFKLAGPGHKLNEPSPSQTTNVSALKTKHAPSKTSESVQRAAEAALARLDRQPKATVVKSKVLKQQIRGELEKEQLGFEQPSISRASENTENSSSEPTGVYFTCPLIGNDILPKSQIEAKIRSFLYLELAEEPLLTSALMINTFTKDKNKVKMCVETLCKYLDNLINNPNEEKFRKIRINNKAFQERVLLLEGTTEFMEAAGFEKQLLSHESTEEYFYVISESNAENVEYLKTVVEALTTAEPVLPEIARNIQVFKPAQTLPQICLDNDFYNLTPEEIKREQKIKTDTVDRNSQLLTKAMREKLEHRQHRRYQYAQLRIRFPDGYILQGTFTADALFSEVRSFVQENLADDWIPFILNSPTGSALVNEDLTIEELELAPSAYITFILDSDVQKDIAAQMGSVNTGPFLKPEIMALVAYM